MLSVQQFATQIKDMFKNNSNPDDIIVDSLVIGVQFGRNPIQSQSTFKEVLELISCLRVLIDAQVYNNDLVIEIYNKATFRNDDLKQLCQRMEAKIFESYAPQEKDLQYSYSLQNQQPQAIKGQENQFLLQQGQNKIPQFDPNQSIFPKKRQQEVQQNQSKQYQPWNMKVPQDSQIQQSKFNQQQDQSQFQFAQNNQSQYQSLYQQDSKIMASRIYRKLQNENEMKSIELARQLQKQFEDEASIQEIQRQQIEEEQKRQLKIQEAEKQNSVECQICLDVIPFDEMATLYCSHIYHVKCLNQLCTTQIQARQFPVLCPCVECKKPMIYTDLSEVLDDRNLHEFQQFTFKNYVESHGDEYSWCPTPDCQYIFVSGGNPYFECPICKKAYCLDCKIEYHMGMNCDQYKAKIAKDKRDKNEKVLDDQFLSFVRGSKFKQCPKCKFWVEKSSGCNHMTCRCKFQFCYVCGGVYLKCACMPPGGR